MDNETCECRNWTIVEDWHSWQPGLHHPSCEKHPDNVPEQPAPPEEDPRIYDPNTNFH
jgi:hypothetical protein